MNGSEMPLVPLRGEKSKLLVSLRVFMTKRYYF